MDWKLESGVVPVSDIDRAESFYLYELGPLVERDAEDATDPTERDATDPKENKVTKPAKATTGAKVTRPAKVSATMRVVQTTPSGSACSVTIGPDQATSDVIPGSRASLQIVVHDIEAARAQLVERGIETSKIQNLSPTDGGKFVFFSDWEGNNWALQELRERIGAGSN